MKYLLAVFLMVCLFHAPAMAQVKADTGSLTVIQDTLIDYLLSKHQQGLIEKKMVTGYRVQIIASTDRNKVIQEKTAFLQIFPDDKIYMNYFQPNYRLRAGDFKTKIEANQYLKKVLHYFPAAWVVNDNINVIDSDDQ